jgi:hypothetical protein
MTGRGVFSSLVLQNSGERWAGRQLGGLLFILVTRLLVLNRLNTAAVEEGEIHEVKCAVLVKAKSAYARNGLAQRGYNIEDKRPPTEFQHTLDNQGYG